MTLNRLLKAATITGVFAAASLFGSAQATIVQFQTLMGDFEVNHL